MDRTDLRYVSNRLQFVPKLLVSKRPVTVSSQWFEHALKESDFDHRPAQDLCCVSRDRDSKSDEGETAQESKGEKLSLESSFPGSPPKCSTPRKQSPPKFEMPLANVDTSSSSSCDDSSQKFQTKGGSCNGKCRICMFREGRNLLLHKAACFS